MTSRAFGTIRAIGPAAAALIVSGAFGCYHYTPITPDEPPALGADVRVRLTDAGGVSLAPLIGNRVEHVDGRLVSVDTAVTLAVTATTDRLGSEFPWRGEQVAIPCAMVARLERRSLDRRKSYLVGGVAAGLVAVAGVGFSLVGSGGGGRGSGTGSPR